MLIYLLLLAGSLKAGNQASDDNYDYEYKGKAPFNFTGSVEVLSNHVFQDQEKTAWKQEKIDKDDPDSKMKWNSKNKKEDYNYANLSFASAKLGVTLQKLHNNSKAGVTFAIKANPGNFEVDQASLFVKNYFPNTKVKSSLRIGYVHGADKKLATTSTSTIFKTNSLYCMPDYLSAPGVANSNSLDTNSGKAMKVVLKAKKIFSKNTNLMSAISYCPKAPNKGSKPEKVDALNSAKNHIGLGLKFYSQSNDWKYQTSITAASASRFKFDKAELNHVYGLSLGKAIMYKTFGFAMNFAMNFNSKVAKYEDSFLNDDNGMKFVESNFTNTRKGKGNGGYIISPTLSFVANSLLKTEFYVSYLYGNRKTEWQKNDKQIHAKSQIVSFGAATPIQNIVLGTKIEVMKFDNEAHQDEKLIDATLSGSKEFTTVDKSDKWIKAISVFVKVKASHNA